MKGLFGRGRDDMPPEISGEDYMEVDLMDSESQKATGGKISIRVERLEDFSDTERVLRSIREGFIVFVKIRGLKDKDMGELKRAVEKLKKSVAANNGDIAGVEQDWLIVAPENATVHR